jgi:multiple sugar transport system permease protein
MASIARPVSRTQPAKRSRFWREVRRNQMAYLFLLPALVILLFVDFFPMFQGIRHSFKLYNLFRPAYRPNVGFEQYRDLLDNDIFWKAFRNSWYFTLGSVACQFALGLLAAVVLNQRIHLRGVLRGIVLIPWVVPGSLAAMMFGLLFTSTGLVNTFLDKIGFDALGIVGRDQAWLSDPNTAMPTIIVTNMWKGFPFFAVMFLAAMQTIPADLYEAAKIDGASATRSFLDITLPSIRPTILVTTLLGTIWTFNSIDLIYIMTYGGPYYATMTLAMFAYQQAFGRGFIGVASAVAVYILALMAVVTAVYLVVYRRFVQSQE